MRKNLLLTCLLTLIATLGMAQTTSFPISLTSADGLPGEVVAGESKVYNFRSPLYTLDEAIESLRFTVVETLNSMPSVNAESYGGRMSDGPGFPYFSLTELTVYDADGNEVEYSAYSNAGHKTDGGGIKSLNDGLRQADNHFHSIWDAGACDDDYHNIILEFVEPVEAFSIEWRTRYSWTYNQPVHVGLTKGEDSYWPMPEQELKVEKISTLEELAEPYSLFVIEGHVEPWWDTSKGRQNYGGGFFEAPCLATREPSAFGVFTLIPVEDVENTYKVEYINTDHYIKRRDSGNGHIDWTTNFSNAMKIKFAQHKSETGDFALTANDGELIIMQDAIMRMGCLKEGKQEEFNRPYATNFSIYKADIKASTILYKLEDEIANIEADYAELVATYAFLDNYDEDGLKNNLEDIIASAKNIVANGNDVTATEILSAKNELKESFKDYYALALNALIDSMSYIALAMEEDEILTSCAPDWINNSYPLAYIDALYDAIDKADIAYFAYETIEDIDKAVTEAKEVIDGFWASKITNVKSLPFRLGREDDGLPGEKYSNDVNRWESPYFYLTDEIDELRFTVFNTYSGRKYKDKPFTAIVEFEIYDLNGEKIELLEEDFSSNSVSGHWGWGYKALCDGNYSLDSRFESISGDGQGDFDGSEYVYLDVTLPKKIGAFKFVLYGRGGNAYQDGPIDFAFGYYGETLTPTGVLFPDEYNAERGIKLETVEDIKDNGIYAIQGLINCNPDWEKYKEEDAKPAFYTSGQRWAGALQSPCAFSIRSTGDGDGTYYIQSLADGKYWAAAKLEADGDYWEGGSTTILKSEAAKFKIEPNNNDALPGSFVIYEYIEDSYRKIDGVDTQCPYVVVQDWGESSNLGRYPVPSLDENDKDGEGEWYIYRLSMDTPYSYWLSNLSAAIMDFGFVEGTDPGTCTDLSAFTAACVKAQNAVEAKDEATAKAMINTLEAVFVDVLNNEFNPVVAGYYVLESHQPLFMEKQGVKKAIYAMEPHDSCDNYAVTFCEEYEIGWMNTPEDFENISAEYLFELIPATEDEAVAEWVKDNLITANEVANAFYIRNVKYDKYITCTDPELAYEGKDTKSWWDIHLSLSETPQAFMVLQNKATAFDIWLPGGGEYSGYENGNLCLHVQGHNNGAGKDGHIVFWSRGVDNSLWNLRYISDSDVTSVDAPMIEGAEVVSTTYYTIDGVASEAPVKGVNIVKYVYSNGVVKTVKIVK